MKKKSFILYTDSKELFDSLSDEQAGKLIKACFTFQCGETPKLDPILSLLFITFKQQFVRENKKWMETRKARKVAGKKGGLQRVRNEREQANATLESELDQANTSKSKQTQTNQAVSVSVSDNVSVNNKKDVKKENNPSSLTGKQLIQSSTAAGGGATIQNYSYGREDYWRAAVEASIKERRQ